MLNEQQQPQVVFKVLGTLRMLIDGQDKLALKLLNDEDLLKKCTHWAQKTPDMVGVNSEASRFLAWLVKNAFRNKSKEVVDSKHLDIFIAVPGSIDVLIKMLTSSHVVMQNEGVIALTITAMLIPKHTELNQIFIDSNVGDAISDFISRISETERITNEIIDNLSTLIATLKKSDTLRDHLDQKRIDEKAIPRIQELATL